ncbi:MAG TPA: hypothetical protein DEB50_11885 [Desulfobacter sp.]|nr:hypothetical protein [Desulfobacter sp.]
MFARVFICFEHVINTSFHQLLNMIFCLLTFYQYRFELLNILYECVDKCWNMVKQITLSNENICPVDYGKI